MNDFPAAPRERAEYEQRRASNPAVSAFVAASAGSGKTKLLTDRLLRLMLAGAAPERIQCLTFTKAAAAEMAVRLQTRLGEWVTLDDPALDARLRALDVVPGEEMRKCARALFARVLDLPGGMRIGTIHAFCQSLLRRFPIEASLSPHFRLLEEADAGFALDEARETVLARPSETVLAALDTAATLLPANSFGRLLARLEGEGARLAPLLAMPPVARARAVARAAGLGDHTDEAVIAAGVRWPDEPTLHAAAGRLSEAGSPKVRERALRLLDWLALDETTRAEHWAHWRCEFLLDSGEPRGLQALVNKKLLDAEPGLRDLFGAEQARIAAVEDSRAALRMVAATLALLDLVTPMLADFARRKEVGDLLGYDDLIARTLALLDEPGAAWVLYKLDGGLDHLLLDEVQDTSGAQWRIADALTAEFFAGAGAAPDRARSFFAVGDPKQSIYSFQGADPDAFAHWRQVHAARVAAAGQEWRDVPLDVSFRSTAPVLALVDAVFRDPSAAAGVVPPGEALAHRADRAAAAGRVELWPLAPRPVLRELPPWEVPEKNLNQTSAPQTLAEGLAAWIAGQTDGSVMLESQGRPLAPGDVLVLVRRRQAFGRALVRALKARGVPVAGLDRMVLTEQPAVQDLLALCDTLLLPRDDLALACVLTSPLGGLDDASLMALAAERHGPLWDTLRSRADERPEWRAAADFIATLLARADYASPHALLAEALGALGGRARLFARLGPEAAEPVDELLSLALAYVRTHPPSLQGFLHWVRRAASEIKREPEGAGGAVRLMTVHGAKGLQAPLVILPDTTGLPREDETGLSWGSDPESHVPVPLAAPLAVPLWAPRKELRSTAIKALAQIVRDAQMAEHNRLLYVALTRAEDRLLVCGWAPRGDAAPETSWYSLVARGFAALGATSSPFDAVPGAWAGECLVHASPQQAEPRVSAHTEVTEAVPLPGWAGQAPHWRPASPPAEPPLPRPLAPSRPDGAGLGPVPRAASPVGPGPISPEQRFRRGRLIHALLQHLPDVPPDQRATAAADYLARPAHGVDPASASRIAAETLAILEHPELAPLFGPDSRAELALSGLAGGAVITGSVDRIAILPDRVLLVDFKTNREPPAEIAATPVLYLRQLAAYRAILHVLLPDRPVRCFLCWTHEPRLDEIPAALLDRHAPGARA